MTRIFAMAAALGVVAAALAGGASSGHAASLPASIGTLDRTAASNATTVRYRGWRGGWRHGWGGWGYRRGYGVGWGWGWPAYYGAGLIAAPYYYDNYYYGLPVYEAAPAYVRPEPPRGAIRQCWVDTDSSRGYGYWRPC